MKRLLFISAALIFIATSAFSRGLQDKVTINSEATGPIEFSHYFHLEKVGKNCPSCHNTLFNIDPAKPRLTATMKTMEEKAASCGSCHNGTRAFSVKGDCAKCHPTRDVTFENDGGTVLFSHEVHTGMYKCSECHPGIFVPSHGKNPPATMEMMEKGDSCGTCHDGGTAFTVKDNCDNCHK